MQKALLDNFPGFGQEELYVNVVDGSTLADRVASDRFKVKNGEKIPMGKFYYQTMRKLYESPDSSYGKFKITDETQLDDNDVVTAVMAVMQAKKSTEELVLWCDTVAQLNQKNLVALLRTLLKLQPQKSLQNLAVNIAAMKMLARLHSKANFPAEIAALHSHWDATCCRSLTTFKSQQQSGRTWWEANSSWASLVLPAAATSAALLEKNRLSVVREQIDEVVSSSETGARLLGVAQRQVHMEKVGELVHMHVDMISEKDITEATLIEARAKFLECLKGEGCDAMARFAPKEVALQYRGQPIVVSVSSALEHYTFAAEALVRSAAVDGGLLDPLWGESELVGNRPKPRIQVDKACVKMAKISRIAVRDELGDEEASSENIQRVLKGKAQFLNSCDRYFRVETSCSLSLGLHRGLFSSWSRATSPL